MPGPLDRTDLVRIFGALKDESQDRQIGDRRNVNNKEARVDNGPSRRLPSGCLLTRISCPAFTHALYGSCVDQRDFYHQALVSSSRAKSNAVGPVFCLREFYGTQAYIDFLASADSAFQAGTPSGSWRLPSPMLADSSYPVHGSFKSILQGDHAGVEYACSGHEGLLRSAGVLGDPPQGRLINKCPVATRLIIDDLFCVSREKASGPNAPAPGRPAASEVLLKQAKEAYAKEGVPGSDNKDIFGERTFTVAGAQIDAVL